MFNMQSGQHRQSFPARLPASRSKVGALATAAVSSKHTKAVTGLMVDSLNRTVVSCGLDGKVKVCFPFGSFRFFLLLQMCDSN